MNSSSKEYFERTRQGKLGKFLEEFQAQEGGEEAWISALPSLKALGEVLKKQGGPFVMGKTRKYIFLQESAMLIVGSFLRRLCRRELAPLLQTY